MGPGGGGGGVGWEERTLVATRPSIILTRRVPAPVRACVVGKRYQLLLWSFSALV